LACNLFISYFNNVKAPVILPGLFFLVKMGNYLLRTSLLHREKVAAGWMRGRVYGVF